jgi:hypothetical protein
MFTDCSPTWASDEFFEDGREQIDRVEVRERPTGLSASGGGSKGVNDDGSRHT